MQAAEEQEIIENGRCFRSTSNISKSMKLPNNTIKDSITTESTGSTVIVKGEIGEDKIIEMKSDGINIPIVFD